MKFKLVEQMLDESKADEQRLIQFAGEDLARRFLSLKHRLKSPENDLYYWIKNKSVEELENAVLELEQSKSKTQIKAQADEGAELVGENEYWKVYHITTFEACQKYGRDTKWCITGINNYGRRYWNKYTKAGIQFYFYITKGEYDPRGTDSKFALAYSPKAPNNYEIFNQQDDKVSGILNAPTINRLPDIDIKMVDTYRYIGEELPVNIAIKNLIIDGSVGIIENDFCDDHYIEHVVLEPGVITIGENAFRHCDSLTSVTIPDSVTSIGGYAFENCDSLTSVVIGNGVTTIGDYAFCNCTGLTSITIGNGVASIGYHAFWCCTGLTNVVIPDSCTTIGAYAFGYCTSLTKMNIPDRVISICDGAFSYCKSLTSVTIPCSVTEIGRRAFEDCESLTSIVLPDNVILINELMFSGCSNLRSITISEGLTSIQSYAFCYCKSLMNITIPDSVIDISETAFYKCSNHFSITCSKDSYAEKYAKRHHIPVNYLKESYSLRFKLVESIDDRLVEKFWAKFQDADKKLISHPFYIYVNNNNEKRNYEEAKRTLRHALNISRSADGSKQSYNKEAVGLLKQMIKDADIDSLVFEKCSDPYSDQIDRNYILTASDRSLRLQAQKEVPTALKYIKDQGIADVPNCLYLTHHRDKQEGNSSNRNKTLVGYNKGEDKKAKAVHMIIHSNFDGKNIKVGEDIFPIFDINNDGQVSEYICKIIIDKKN